MASIYSGVHGNWISFQANECSWKASARTDQPICCYNYPVKGSGQEIFSFNNIYKSLQNQTNACVCLDLNNKLQRTYAGLTCRYLFSSLKDHFVLICSLMGVGSGCDLWFVLYLLKCLCKRHSPHEVEMKRIRSRVMSVIEQDDNDFDIENKHLPSPLIPVVGQNWID